MSKTASKIKLEGIAQRARRLNYDLKNTITHYVLESCKNDNYQPDHSRGEVREPIPYWPTTNRVKKYIRA